MHALFDRNTANNRWGIKSALLKQFIEYFGQKTEQLDIYADDGKVTFISFTEKVVNRKNGALRKHLFMRNRVNVSAEVLKHPLRTAVSVNKLDFEVFSAQEKMHVVISVKDFKSIVAHAETLNAVINTFYSTPGRPLQFSYSMDGLHCQFTLMTVGDYTPSAAAAQSAAVSIAPTRASSRIRSITGPSSETSRSDKGQAVLTNMPPPAIPNTRKPVRKLGQKDPSGGSKTAQQDDNDDSLFVPLQEEDRRWDPADYENDEETLAWDASANNVSWFQVQMYIPCLTRARMPVSTQLSGIVALLHDRIRLTVTPLPKDCHQLKEYPK
jgi:cell cycle checkpoint control protein RAD9A